MMIKYPKYSQGDCIKVESRMSSKNKKILDKFIQFISTNAGKNRASKIRRVIVQVHDIIGKDLNKFNVSDINTYLILLNQSDLAPHTRNDIRKDLKRFLKWYYKDLTLIENIRLEKNDISSRITEDNLVNKEDVEKMLRFAESYRDKALLFLVFESGARPQEIIDLRWKDIRFYEGYADITLYSSKTRTSRTFPVKKASAFLYDWKQNYHYPDVNNSDYVFPSRYRNKHITTSGMNKILRRMAVNSGINKDVWGYLFRHSLATRLYEELPTPIVEKLMGHQNMFKVYAHISSKKAREVMLQKIYHVNHLSPSDREELEGRVEALELRLNRFVALVKKKKHIGGSSL